jgi:hypothetical protein
VPADVTSPRSFSAFLPQSFAAFFHILRWVQVSGADPPAAAEGAMAPKEQRSNASDASDVDVPDSNPTSVRPGKRYPQLPTTLRSPTLNLRYQEFGKVRNMDKRQHQHCFLSAHFVDLSCARTPGRCRLGTTSLGQASKGCQGCWQGW